MTSGWATRRSELRLTTWRPPRLLPRVCRQNEFSQNTDPPGTVPTGPFYNTHTVPSLNFACLSRGVPLRGAPGSGLTCPFSPWGSIKRIFPGYWPPWGQSGQQYLQPALGYPGVRTTFNHMATPLVFSIKRIFPDKTNFPRILTRPHGPVPELCLALPWRTAARGTRLRSHVPIFPLGLDKTNFPRVLAPMGAKGATIPTTHTRSRT